jgi:hypothetical protein
MLAFLSFEWDRSQIRINTHDSAGVLWLEHGRGCLHFHRRRSFVVVLMSRRDEYHYWMMLWLQSHSPAEREVADGQLCSQSLESLHQPDHSPDADLLSELTVDGDAAFQD